MVVVKVEDRVSVNHLVHQLLVVEAAVLHLVHLALLPVLQVLRSPAVPQLE